MSVGLAVGATAIVFVVAFAPNTAEFEGMRGVKIAPASPFEEVVDSLSTRGILRSRSTFSLMARATGWGGQIKAGYYEVEPGASNYDILEKLRKNIDVDPQLALAVEHP